MGQRSLVRFHLKNYLRNGMTLNHIIVGSYFLILSLLTVYCIHRYCILYLYFKHKNKRQPAHFLPDPLPFVTVQLPVYNELYVVERLIKAAVNLRYPEERLEIQVLDDSTDETSIIAEKLVRQLKEEGHFIQYFHRNERHGYKAGALQEGLRQAKGELIAIFDADFVPQQDFLLRTVSYFADPSIGMVQGMWGHINRTYSALTEVQAMLLDAHFALEQSARHWSGRFFNFNGTAGIWRKECIISAGGWQHDTLTEDLDLSYRAQLHGWKFIFLPQVITPAEIPVEISAFKSQQHRWCKGGIETARKLLPMILRSKQPWRIKLEALFHLTCNMNYLFVFFLSLLAYPALLIRIKMGWKSLFLFDFVVFWSSTIPIALYYVISQREVGESWITKVLYIPFIMAMGIGLCINNGKGVLEALLRYASPFVRTPKFHIENKFDQWRHKKYGGYRKNVVTAVELGFGLCYLSAIIFAANFRVYDAIPFLGLFCAGFFYVSLLSVFQKRPVKVKGAVAA